LRQVEALLISHADKQQRRQNATQAQEHKRQSG